MQVNDKLQSASPTKSKAAPKVAYKVLESAYGGYDVCDKDLFRMAWIGDLAHAKEFVVKVLQGKIDDEVEW